MYTGNVIDLKAQSMTKLNKKVSIEAKTLNEWDKQTEKDICTPIIKQMVEYLYPKPTVIEFEVDSVADQVAKIDLALSYPEVVKDEVVVSAGQLVGFQLKSSEYFAKVHLEKNKNGAYYDGQYYPCAGVFWCQEFSLEATIALAKFTGGCLHPGIEDAIALLEKIKPLATKSAQGLYMDAVAMQRVIKDPVVWKALQAFKLISVAGGRMFYANE